MPGMLLCCQRWSKRLSASAEPSTARRTTQPSSPGRRALLSRPVLCQRNPTGLSPRAQRRMLLQLGKPALLLSGILHRQRPTRQLYRTQHGPVGDERLPSLGRRISSPLVHLWQAGGTHRPPDAGAEPPEVINAAIHLAPRWYRSLSDGAGPFACVPGHLLFVWHLVGVFAMPPNSRQVTNSAISPNKWAKGICAFSALHVSGLRQRQ